VRLNNIRYWWPVIADDEPWDWSYLVRILRYKLSQMEEGFRESACTVGAPMRARELHMAVLLCDHLLDEDWYWGNGEASARLMGWSDRQCSKHTMWMMRRDARELGRTLGKYLLTWWW
jgi:hypothetical protein